MRLAGLVIASACAGPEPARPAPANNASPPPPALIDIARAANRPITNDGDMRALEPYTGDLDVMIGRLGDLFVLMSARGTRLSVVNGRQRGRTVDAAAAFERFLDRHVAQAEACRWS